MTTTPIRSALVTGASAGLGAAFARSLAQKGWRLVLTARRRERLEALTAELRANGSAQVEILTADLADPEDLLRVEQAAAVIDDLDLLVNNAGFGLTGKFWERPADESESMLRVHNTATLRLCRAALPGMLARGRGGIINVSSVAAFLKRGGDPLYSSTKALLNSFSENLQEELYGTGVRIQALCPGFTHTEFHDVLGAQGDTSYQRLPGCLWMDAADVVEQSLRALPRGGVIFVPGLINRLMVLTSRVGLAPLLMTIGKRLRAKP